MENAGSLEPGVSYIYERADGIVYARKMGDPPDKRFEIGYEATSPARLSECREAELWKEIVRAAKHNSALQDALDRVKVIYELSKQEESISHHSV